MWTAKDQRRSRPYTNKLLDMAEEGSLDWEQIARDALGWMSEDDVKQFARSNDYITEDPDEEDDEELEFGEDVDAGDPLDIEYDR